MVSEKTLVLTTRKVPLTYIYRACLKSSTNIYLSCLLERTTECNSEDTRFSFYLSQLLNLFSLLYGLLNSVKVSILSYISSKGVPDGWS